MSANKSQDGDTAESSSHQDPHDMQASGTGAASALERMKALHALRHKRQHGARTAGPGHEDDRTPER